MFLVSIRERVGVGEYETSFANYLAFFTEPLYILTFVRTAVMSVLATMITLLIGFPVSYYIAKIAKGRLQSVLFLLCLIPFWVSELVRTFGWMILLRETGMVSSFLQWTGLADQPVEMLYNDVAIMIGLVYTSMLFMVVPLVTTLESLDDSVIEAGYDLGGSGVSVLREIIIPHAMPGIVSGSIVVFMLSFGNYLTPTMLGGKDSSVVHPADLLAVHRPVQLGARRGLRLHAAVPVVGHRLGHAEAHRPDAEEHDGVSAMIPSIHQPRSLKLAYRAYVVLFFLYLALPLAVVSVFAFNDSQFPSLPWQGFTWAWFFGVRAADDRRVPRASDPARVRHFRLRRGLRLAAVGRGRHHQRLSVQPLRLPPQGPVLRADAAAAGDPGYRARHLDPGLLLDGRQQGLGQLTRSRSRRCAPA